MDLKIIFEDDSILIIDKPAGVIVNRADTVKESNTIQDWAEERIGISSNSKTDSELSEFIKRGGVVHRLDKETSGLLILAKNEQAFVNLQAQFKNREVEKKYIALVHGAAQASGVIDGKIARVGSFGKFGIDDAGRESHTEYQKEGEYTLSDEVIAEILDKNEIKLNKNRIKYLKTNGRIYSLVNVFPKTGRTHQIRVHMKSLSLPLVSDLIYGPSKLLKFDLLWCPRLFLHAAEIKFNHPVSQKLLIFESKLPGDISASLEFLKGA